MGYVIPNGYSRVTFEYDAVSLAGSAPVWGISIESNPTSDMLDLFQAWYETDWAPLVSEAYILRRIVMRNDFVSLEREILLAGESTAADCQPNTALLVSLSSGLVGRANRGRVYFPGVLNEDTVSGSGLVFAGKIEDYDTAFQALGTALAAEDASMVILHSNSSDPTPVVGYTIQQRVATQRRRLRQ